MQDYGVDGLRIDTVKHIRKYFDHSIATGVFTLGEVLINDTDYAAQYTGEWLDNLHSTMDFDDI